MPGELHASDRVPLIFMSLGVYCESWNVSIHDHSKENNDTSIQFLYLTSRRTQYCNYRAIKHIQLLCTAAQFHLTRTMKGKMTHSTIYCTLHKDNAIYTMLNVQSGLVHLSCPPECCWLSLLLTGKQPVLTIKGLSHVLKCGLQLVSARLWNIVRMVICSNFSKCVSRELQLQVLF